MNAALGHVRHAAQEMRVDKTESLKRFCPELRRLQMGNPKLMEMQRRPHEEHGGGTGVGMASQALLDRTQSGLLLPSTRVEASQEGRNSKKRCDRGL